VLGKESEGSLADEAVCKQSTACCTRFISEFLSGYWVHQQMKSVKRESDMKHHKFVLFENNIRARCARV